AGRLPGGDRPAGERGELGGDVRGVQRDAAGRVRRHGRGGGLRRQDAGGLGVGEHVRQPGGRVVQLQRQVRRACPQDREQGGDHVGRARQRQRDDPLGGGPAGQEQAGDAVDALVQLGVGEGLVPGDDGGRAGGARRLRGEHLRDR